MKVSINLWSVYIEFIERFKTITHKGIPLPLVAHFFRYLPSNLKMRLQRSKLRANRNLPIIKLKHVQPYFNRMIQSIPRYGTAPINGYTVINTKLLRIPSTLSAQIFNPYKTLILSPYRTLEDRQYSFPKIIVSLQQSGVAESIQHNIHRAKQIFFALSDHPVFGNRRFQSAFLREIPILVQMIEAVDAFFRKYPTSILVMGTTAFPFQRVMTIVGHRWGIPSIWLQHSNILIENHYLPILSTVNAVYGKVEKEWYMMYGADSRQVIITGHPRFDEIFLRKYLSRKSIMNLLHLHPAKKSVLIATQLHVPISVYKRLIKLLTRYPRLQIILKPHPSEIYNHRYRFRAYQMLSRYKSVRLVTNQAHLYDLIKHSDYVVPFSSTVGLEAMLLGKPIFLQKTYLPSSYRQGRAYRLLKPLISRNLKALATSIHIASASNSYERFILKRSYAFLKFAYPHLRSTQQIAQVISVLKR